MVETALLPAPPANDNPDIDLRAILAGMSIAMDRDDSKALGQCQTQLRDYLMHKDGLSHEAANELILETTDRLAEQHLAKLGVLVAYDDDNTPQGAAS
jgi:hypothetical protein